MEQYLPVAPPGGPCVYNGLYLEGRGMEANPPAAVDNMEGFGTNHFATNYNSNMQVQLPGILDKQIQSDQCLTNQLFEQRMRRHPGPSPTNEGQCFEFSKIARFNFIRGKIVFSFPTD